MTNSTDGAPPASSPPRLSTLQRAHVQAARTVLNATADDLAAGYHPADPPSQLAVYSFALTVTRGTVRELLEIIDALTGGTHDG